MCGVRGPAASPKDKKESKERQSHPAEHVGCTGSRLAVEDLGGLLGATETAQQQESGVCVSLAIRLCRTSCADHDRRPSLPFQPLPTHQPAGVHVGKSAAPAAGVGVQDFGQVEVWTGGHGQSGRHIRQVWQAASTFEQYGRRPAGRWWSGKARRCVHCDSSSEQTLGATLAERGSFRSPPCRRRPAAESSRQ